jgi:hypothetical protein
VTSFLARSEQVVEWKEVLVELYSRELASDGVTEKLRFVSLVIWVGLVGMTWALAPPIREDWMEVRHSEIRSG